MTALTMKKVQWAEDLEEVYYFVTPRSLREDFKKKIKKLKRKACEISDKPIRIITTVGEASTSMLDFLTSYSQSGTFETDLLSYEELDKECEKLFEMCEIRTITAREASAQLLRRDSDISSCAIAQSTS